MDKSDKGWRQFIELCANAPDADTLSSLLNLFLTAEERDDLAMRYLIIKELIAGTKTQREIAKDLNVSIAKITRGSNELKRTDENVIQFLKKTT